MRTSVTVLAVTLVATLLLPPSETKAQGNLVVNGGFDSGPGGWTLSNGGYISVGNPTFGVELDSVIPSAVTDPTATQIITDFTPGLTYLVSGDYFRSKDRGGGSPTNFSFGVSIGGVRLFETTLPAPNYWTNFSFVYTATSSSADLSLSAQINGTGISYRIDNIAIQAVPEPSTLGLMALGGFVGVVSLWVRKSARRHS